MNLRRILEIKRKRKRKMEAYLANKKNGEAADIIRRSVRDGLEYMKNRKRKHADYFEANSKVSKEIGVVRDFLDVLCYESDDYYVSLMPASDPPDVKAVMNSGKEIYFEVTELVNEKAIEKQIVESDEYCREILVWDKDKFSQKINEICGLKNKKCQKVFKEGRRVILLLFTDEPRLNSETIRDYLKEFEFDFENFFDDIYILTGYEPVSKGCVAMKIK